MINQKYNILLYIIVFFLTSCNTDEHQEYYSNGKLKEEYHLLNGKFDGKTKAYYENGKIQAKGQYKNGQMTGIWYYFYDNGFIQSIQEFKNGILVSLDFWDIKGNQLVKNGTGVVSYYNPDGQIGSVMSYKNNVFHGKCETWYLNGVKATELYYEYGKPIGIWKYWDENGSLVKTEDYRF